MFERALHRPPYLGLVIPPQALHEQEQLVCILVQAGQAPPAVRAGQQRLHQAPACTDTPLPERAEIAGRRAFACHHAARHSGACNKQYHDCSVQQARMIAIAPLLFVQLNTEQPGIPADQRVG